MITDEMVEKAAAAIFIRFYGGSSGLDDMAESIAKDHARAALEAVAPMIAAEALGRAYNTARAQGIREAAQLVDHEYDASRLLARAQEIDPQ